MYLTTGILGLLLMIAPYIVGYTNNPVAFWTSIVVGAGVIGLSVIERFVHDTGRWEYWVIGMLGIVAVLSPFVLGFSYHNEAMGTIVLGGLVIAFMAGSKLYMQNQR